MVRYDKKTISNDKLDESDYDSDLDINFITKLDDFDITNNDTDARNHFQLDPSVWATPVKPITPSKAPSNMFKGNEMGRKFPMQPPPGLSSPSLAQQQTNALQQFIGATPQNVPPKIMSLEEIERNIINQQQQMQQKLMMQEKLAAIQSKARKQPPMNGPFPPHFMNGPPPPFPAVPQPPPPHLQQQGAPMNKFNPLMNITNHPMNMNFHPNFAMHQQRPNQQQQLPPNAAAAAMNRLPPHHLIQGAPLMYQNAQNSAQFNQRLVQEIQQNHPMLNQRNQPQMRDGINMMMGGNNRNMGNQYHQQQQHHHNPYQNHQHHHQQRFNNGKMEEYDEYANLMSNRDKQFLITIQLMQLNTETPYFDDYYYTMYKERQRFRSGENESQAHRDNQLNHPFTQPKGHAQMLLRQFNNIGKNGLQNQKNGMGRERRSSESSMKNEKENPTPRTYTPLQFENSLGKLQCGSVTAPRKIIDMEVVNNSENGGQQAPSEKKSRQILLQIELLYKVVLKLEDLQHPLAISATIILKVIIISHKHLILIKHFVLFQEKREKQRLQLEQEARERDSEDASISGSTKSSISITEPETQSDLQTKLQALLVIEKIPGILVVRKGRVS